MLRLVEVWTVANGMVIVGIELRSSCIWRTGRMCGGQRVLDSEGNGTRRTWKSTTNQPTNTHSATGWDQAERMHSGYFPFPLQCRTRSLSHNLLSVRVSCLLSFTGHELRSCPSVMKYYIIIHPVSPHEVWNHILRFRFRLRIIYSCGHIYSSAFFFFPFSSLHPSRPRAFLFTLKKTSEGEERSAVWQRMSRSFMIIALRAAPSSCTSKGRCFMSRNMTWERIELLKRFRSWRRKFGSYTV